MVEAEVFAHNIRKAGGLVRDAEETACRMEAEEKKQFALLQVRALSEGYKSVASQTTYADASEEMYQARINRGVAKAGIAAAKANLLAAEVEFKVWQTRMATIRQEKRVYGA
jgi:hypothetical protein